MLRPLMLDRATPSQLCLVISGLAGANSRPARNNLLAIRVWLADGSGSSAALKAS